MTTEKAKETYCSPKFEVFELICEGIVCLSLGDEGDHEQYDHADW